MPLDSRFSEVDYVYTNSREAQHTFSAYSNVKWHDGHRENVLAGYLIVEQRREGGARIMWAANRSIVLISEFSSFDVTTWKNAVSSCACLLPCHPGRTRPPSDCNYIGRKKCGFSPIVGFVP